ncbi:hypothetical protein ACQ4LE_007498 [Meloidogyne hapla]
MGRKNLGIFKINYFSVSSFRHSNNLNYLHGGSSSSAQKSSYESRNESLSQQLGAAQSQVIRLETELSNTNTAKSYAESRLLTLQREYNAVVKRNAEIVEVWIFLYFL